MDVIVYYVRCIIVDWTTIKIANWYLKWSEKLESRKKNPFHCLRVTMPRAILYPIYCVGKPVPAEKPAVSWYRAWNLPTRFAIKVTRTPWDASHRHVSLCNRRTLYIYPVIRDRNVVHCVMWWCIVVKLIHYRDDKKGIRIRRVMLFLKRYATSLNYDKSWIRFSATKDKARKMLN